MTFIDSNVLIDIATADAAWSRWSLAAVEAAAREGNLLINEMVYAELSVRYQTAVEVDAFLGAAGILIEPTPRIALFVAAKAFQRYRAAGGMRTGVLPDFLIGAHADVAGRRLLTRDARRYRTYFPQLELIAPGG